MYSSTSRPSPSSRFESTRVTIACRSLGASSVCTVKLNRCPIFISDCIVFTRLLRFVEDSTSRFVRLSETSDYPVIGLLPPLKPNARSERDEEEKPTLAQRNY